MKKLTVFIAGLFLVVLSLDANAQVKTGADYFVGKWKILVKGLPDGDAKMFVILDKKDSTMSGVIQDSTGTEMAKCSKVELKDNEVTLYFTTQGYDVNLLMTKKDDDHVTGSMMGMFDADGDRVKVPK